jgi:hypothetical protein
MSPGWSRGRIRSTRPPCFKPCGDRVTRAIAARWDERARLARQAFRVRERMFGKVTQHMLEHCDIPILIAH